MKKLKYGISPKVSGVYKITNCITGDFYIGSSKSVGNRLSIHFNRDKRKFKEKPMYRDMIMYGDENFKIELLEECEVDKLIERELYYYETLKPTYNVIKPCENNFLSKELRELAIIGTKKNHNLKEKYNNEYYKNKFKMIHKNKFKPCVAINIETNDVVKEFICLRDGARWISETTNYKSKNKVSKIKEVCDGKRKIAYGFKWEYIQKSNDYPKGVQ